MVGALGHTVSDLPLDTKTEKGFPGWQYSVCTVTRCCQEPQSITNVCHRHIKREGDTHIPILEVGRYSPHYSQSHPGLKGLGEELTIIH